MKLQASRMLMQAARIISLVLLAALGTMTLMRFAPGYFTDAHELDPEYAEAARTRVKAQEDRQGKVLSLTRSLAEGWLHGDLGRSKQYDVPVTELIIPRMKISLKLLLSGVASGWIAALILALPLATRKNDKGESVITACTIILLAVPLGVLATVCLLTEFGGPVAVLMTVVAIRDFKLVYRLLRPSKLSSQLVYARAQGITGYRIVCIQLLPSLLRELLAIGVVSVVTALSAIVPIEVIFDTPGLGQLAWSAAMNRDLPVLLGVTLFMATAVGLLTIATEYRQNEATL